MKIAVKPDVTTTFIELPRCVGMPVKIDVILQERLNAFMKARRIRRFTFNK